MRLKTKYLLLGLIILLSLSVRLYDLSDNSFWLDETITSFFSERSVAEIIEFNVKDDFHPPLYYIITTFWADIFGSDEFFGRLSSVLFGVLCVPLIYLVAKEIYDEKAGLISALIIALSPFNLLYSQFFRPYILICMLSILSFYFYVRYSKKSRKIDAIMCAASNIVLIYVHTFGAFMPLVQSIDIMLKNFFFGKNIKNIVIWILSQALVVLAYVPWAIVLLGQASRLKADYWISRPGLFELGATFYQFAGSYLLTVFFVAILIAYYRKNTSSGRWKESIVLDMWLYLPVLIMFAASFAFSPVYQIRYVIFSSVPLYIIAGGLLSSLKKKHLAYVLSVLILMSGLALADDYSRIDIEDWDGASGYVCSNRGRYDYVLLDAHYNIYPFAYYCLTECFDDRLYGCAKEKGVFPVHNLSQVQKIYNIGSRPVYLILSHNQYTDPHGILFSYLNSTKTLDSTEMFYGHYENITVYHFS